MENIEHLMDEKDGYRYKQAGEREYSLLRYGFLENCRIAGDAFAQKWLLNLSKVGTCPDTVATIIEQVRRRKLYFHIFHKTNGLNEAKEVALYAFWILKLQPFYWRGRESRLSSNSELNAKMAIAFFIMGLDFYAVEKTKNDKDGKQYKLAISDYIVKNLVHSFVFRDISKEAMMDLAESLIVEV